MSNRYVHSNSILIRILRETIAGIRFAAVGHCPECGEDVTHYKKCKIARALAHTKKFERKDSDGLHEFNNEASH